ncbi:MAG: (2Fe-2S)-binding protein [Myxococcaceae bacterium]|nr:(2Fe-2S)-binding protein [Myxococcaceae bacterium]
MPRLPHPAPSREIAIELEGQTIPCREGDSVASALIAAGEHVFARSVKYHRPRGPWCMTGECSHCLMRVDGLPNVFTCRTRVRPGMRIERQNAFPSAEHDVFRAIDFLFPKGLDHHEMFAGVPVAEQVMAKVARHLAGLGLLPEKEAPPRLPHETLEVPVAIAGAGPAGLAAARELSNLGVRFLVLERETEPGGRLRYGAVGPKDPPLSAFAQVSSFGALRLCTTIIGLYDDERGRYLAAVEETADGPRLLKVYAQRFLIATGGHPTMWPFVNNDIPGVYSARAIATLIRRDGVLPARSFALVGTGPELYDLSRLIVAHGAAVEVIVDVAADPPEDAPHRSLRGEALKAHGRTGVRGFSFRPLNGRNERVDCDAVGVCVPASPAFELASQGGAEVELSEAHQTFRVRADEDGFTAGPGISVAGDVLGQMTAAQAADSGARAARAIARVLGAVGGAR